MCVCVALVYLHKCIPSCRVVVVLKCRQGGRTSSLLAPHYHSLLKTNYLYIYLLIYNYAFELWCICRLFPGCATFGNKFATDMQHSAINMPLTYDIHVNGTFKVCIPIKIIFYFVAGPNNVRGLLLRSEVLFWLRHFQSSLADADNALKARPTSSKVSIFRHECDVCSTFQ